MTRLNVIIDEAHAADATALLTRRYQASVNQVIQTEWEGLVNLEQLTNYYEGDYREQDEIQELAAAGWTPIPAADFTEDDWEQFANDLELYHSQGHDLEFFTPCTRPRHDFKRWMEEPDAGA